MKSELESYELRAKNISEDINTLERRSLVLSTFRLITFVLIVIGIILGFKMKQPVFYAASFLFFAGFISLCVFHNKISEKTEYLKALLQVNKQYICRINGDVNGLLNVSVESLKKQADIILATDKFCGNEFSINNHDYSNDLDLFGKQSLFALFNVSETAFGRSFFANELLYAPTNDRSVDDIREIQEAVKDLSNKVDFLQSYQAIAKLGNLSKMPESLINFATAGKRMKKSVRAAYRLLPIMWILPIITLFVSLKATKVCCLSVLLINFIVWVVGVFKNADYFKSVEGMSRQVSSLNTLFQKLENESFNSSLMNKLVFNSSGKGGKVSVGLSKLEFALIFAKLRSQPILAVAFNLFVPLDWFVVDLLGTWAEEYGSELDKCIDSLSRIETMMCLAQVAIITPDHCYPDISDSSEPAKNAYVRAENVVHPLINQDVVVKNSVVLDSNIALITGSNMSGKTTLIRTVGVNTLLSYMGAPVMASTYSCGRMRIISSMRIVDSLEENMSTFKAELVRIASIINASIEEKPLLFLIDEIFRGTNSDDRTEGALTVLNKLSHSHICGMMTTHDYNLIDKTENKSMPVVYYHFSEQYTDEGISFDYKLQSGISRSSNAQYLMRLVGIK